MINITSLQYEALGRLTLAFNGVEFTMEIMMAQFLKIPDWGISTSIAGEGMFRQKANRFDRILGIFQQSNPAFDVQVQEIRDLIKRATKLANQRNDYVHALIVHDFATNITRIKIGKSKIAFNARFVKGLAVEAIMLADELEKKCGELNQSILLTEG